ncbi:ABC transporter substrate-binding protein [Enterovirga aerilata]|uniref:ABC transporter substrate-binding protein n=1 Tax=Enterovirga aerilata TaxID=2730920 RepID=A0A849I6B7_9HYPH|nr:ABC transporter substrate-binding protein [Enterovirga sp. DB1703]NNM72861.1 ABC transporter substrate-binding protein [Enterovirga sp. DB1703]
MLHRRSLPKTPRPILESIGAAALRWAAKAARTGLAAGLFAAAASPLAAAPERPRVVSINLCTDQLLLSLADPDQILGLSPFVRDPRRSWVRDAAARFPILSGTAEEVLVLKPDLVLAGRFTRRATRELLKAHGVEVIEFEAATSVAQVVDQVRRAGALLGQPGRAEARIAEIEAAAARARAAALVRPVTVLPLQRRGWISGRETLMTSFLETVGLRNAGGALGPHGGLARLEEIVALRADMLLVSRSETAAEDQGSALLHHPALKGRYPPERRLVLPEQMTVCGGPEIAAALDRLAAEIERLR